LQHFSRLPQTLVSGGDGNLITDHWLLITGNAAVCASLLPSFTGIRELGSENWRSEVISGLVFAGLPKRQRLADLICDRRSLTCGEG
jgi:hypothetical protein